MLNETAINSGRKISLPYSQCAETNSAKAAKISGDGMTDRGQDDADPRMKPVSGTVRKKPGVSGQ